MHKYCRDQPLTITTDKHAPYVKAIKEIKDEEVLKEPLHHMQNQYLNNIIEQDHRHIKRRIRPMLGFNYFKTANRTFKGIEAMTMMIKEQTIYLQEQISKLLKFTEFHAI